jgi:hypothetical protein
VSYPLPPSKNLRADEMIKWNEIMKFFKKHPEMLLELMPDGMNMQINSQNKQKVSSKRGQTMIPELGVVPPQQSGPFGFNSNHNRKKSHGDLNNTNNSFKRETLNPTVAKFSNPSTFPQRVSDTPSETYNITSNKNKFKPNTPNEYQTAKFLENNTVNKSDYKVNFIKFLNLGTNSCIRYSGKEQ